MPRIPIIPPRDIGAGGTGGGPETLPPEQAAALRVLEDRTARIDRELAVSQSWRAAVDRLVQADNAEDGPPPGFTRSFLEEADKERAAALRTVPVERQRDLEQDLLSVRSDFADRAASVEASGLALRRRAGLYRALDEYRSGVTHDPGLFDEAVMRMDGLSSDLGLPEERLTAMRHEVRDVLGNAAVDGLMDEPDRAARVLSDGLFDDVLSEASKARRLSEAQTEASRRNLLSREQAVSALTTQARQGTAPDEAILAAERDGVLTPAEAAVLRQANAKAVEEASQRTARIERVTMATEPFDPSNPEDHAAVSAYWDSVAEVHASDDLAEQKERELGFIGRTGILPDGLARKYQGALLSADPTLAVSGAAMLTQLQGINPAMVEGIPQRRLQRAQAIAQYASLDLPPERVIELAENDIETESTTAPLAILPSAAIVAAGIGAGPADIVGLGIPGDGVESNPEKSAGSADVIGVLPEAIAAVLAEEGVADDAEAAAALAQLTTAALALDLPLNDETAAAMGRLANGDRAVEAETAVPAIAAVVAAVGKKVLQEALKRLPSLWKWLQRRREKEGPKDNDGQLPAPDPLLPGQVLDRPMDTLDEEAADPGQEDGSLLESEATDEDPDPGMGDAENEEAQIAPPERPDWLSLDPERLQREIEDEKTPGRWELNIERGTITENDEFANEYWEQHKDDPEAPEPHRPYDERVPTYAAKVGKGGRQFIRVFGAKGSPQGQWMLKPELFDKIRELPNATQVLKDTLALKYEPEYFTVVEVPEGTEMRYGGVNEHPEWGRGGVMQFEFTGRWEDEWFSEPKRIKP